LWSGSFCFSEPGSYFARPDSTAPVGSANSYADGSSFVAPLDQRAPALAALRPASGENHDVLRMALGTFGGMWVFLRSHALTPFEG